MRISHEPAQMLAEDDVLRTVQLFRTCINTNRLTYTYIPICSCIRGNIDNKQQQQGIEMCVPQPLSRTMLIPPTSGVNGCGKSSEVRSSKALRCRALVLRFQPRHQSEIAS